MSSIDQFWSEVTADVDAEREQRLLTQARVASASTWGFLAEASSPQEFDDRLSLADDRLHKAIAAVVGDDPAAHAEVYPRLVESFQTDFDTLIESRRKEALAQSRRGRLRRTKDSVTRARRAQGQQRQGSGCPACGGKGLKPCTNCGGGGMNSSGYCGSCNGDGAHLCPNCGGTGSELGKKARRKHASSEPEFIQMCRRIVENRQHETWEGVIVDMQTANVVTMVYDALSGPDKAEKFEKIGPEAFVDFAWSRVSKRKQATDLVEEDGLRLVAIPAGEVEVGDDVFLRNPYGRMDGRWVTGVQQNSDGTVFFTYGRDGSEGRSPDWPVDKVVYVHASTRSASRRQASDLVDPNWYEKVDVGPEHGECTYCGEMQVNLASGECENCGQEYEVGPYQPDWDDPSDADLDYYISSRQAAFGDQWESSGPNSQALRHGPLIADVSDDGWANIYEADDIVMQPMMSEHFDTVEAAKAWAASTMADLAGPAHQTSMGSKQAISDEYQQQQAWWDSMTPEQQQEYQRQQDEHYDSHTEVVDGCFNCSMWGPRSASRSEQEGRRNPFGSSRRRASQDMVPCPDCGLGDKTDRNCGTCQGLGMIPVSYEGSRRKQARDADAPIPAGMPVRPEDEGKPRGAYGWPYWKESPHFPGERSLSCPSCGSQKITMVGRNLTPQSPPGYIQCQSCGYKTLDISDPVSEHYVYASKRQAEGSRKQAGLQEQIDALSPTGRAVFEAIDAVRQRLTPDDPRWWGTLGDHNVGGTARVMIPQLAQQSIRVMNYDPAGAAELDALRHALEDALAAHGEAGFRTATHKQAMPNPADLGVSVGDFFYSSWGYDQTNVNFYEVTGLTGASVRLREVRSRVDGPGVVPVPGAYEKWGQPSEEFTVRIKSGYRDRPSVSSPKHISGDFAWLWDGTPKYDTTALGYPGH